MTKDQNVSVGRDLSAPARRGEVLPPETPEVRQQRRNDYNRLARTAKLRSIVLANLDFKIQPESLGVEKSLLSRDLAATAEVLSAGNEDGPCIATIEWTVKYSFKRKVIVRCAASYIVSYDGMKGFPEDVIGIFVDTNAKGASYAYFRALYAHLDWSANLGSAPLPIVQIQAKV